MILCTYRFVIHLSVCHGAISQKLENLFHTTSDPIIGLTIYNTFTELCLFTSYKIIIIIIISVDMQKLC